jgi:hypothetical protein
MSGSGSVSGSGTSTFAILKVASLAFTGALRNLIFLSCLYAVPFAHPVSAAFRLITALALASSSKVAKYSLHLSASVLIGSGAALEVCNSDVAVSVVDVVLFCFCWCCCHFS